VTTPLLPAERAYSLSTRSGWEEFVTAPPRQRPDLLTTAQLSDLSGQARAEYEEQRSVWHANLGPLRTPQMRAVHEQLDDITEANRQDGDKVKGAAVIDAFPGLGKSTIAQVFAREFHQRQVSLYGPLTGAGHDRIPVAHVCLTSSTSKRSFNAMLCRFFGLPGHDRGNAEELGHKAADAVLACDVQLCVVDDVHFLDPRRRDGRDVANHFKYLANTFPVTFLFVGVGLERRGWSARAWPPGRKSSPRTAAAGPPGRAAGPTGEYFARLRLIELLTGTHPGYLPGQLPPGPAVRRRMKELQSVLGDHQDAVVARGLDRDLGVSSYLAGENAFPYGLLHERDAQAALLLQEQARRVWQRSSRSKDRRWMRQ